MEKLTTAPLGIDRLLDSILDWVGLQPDFPARFVINPALGRETTTLLGRALQTRKWMVAHGDEPGEGSSAVHAWIADDSGHSAPPVPTPRGDRQLLICVALPQYPWCAASDPISPLIAAMGTPAAGIFVESTCGRAGALGILTHAAAADRSGMEAIAQFAAFRHKSMAAHARRLRDGLEQAVAVSERALQQLQAAEHHAFLDRHSVKQVVRNVWAEARYRLRQGDRKGLPYTTKSLMPPHRRLREELAAFSAGHESTSLLETIASAAVRTRVAFLVESGTTFGGLEQWVCDMAREFARHGLLPYLFTRDATVAGLRIEQEFPGEIICLGSAAGGLAEAITRYRPSAVVVNHAYEGVADIPPGIGVVEVLHNLYFWQRGSRVHGAARSRVDRFVAVSDAVARYSIDQLEIPVARCVTVPHSLSPVGLFRPQRSFLAQRIGRLRFEILAVGNLYPQKNFLCLVHAFARAKLRARGAKLRIVGAASQPEYVAKIKHAIAQLGLSDSVLLAGALDRRQLSRAYADASVFVLPSLYEGYGLVSLEARYFGLPLVLADTGHSRSLLEQGGAGLLVDIAQPFDALEPEAVMKAAFEPSEAAVEALAEALVAAYESHEALAVKALDERDTMEAASVLGYIDVLHGLGVY